MLEHWRHSPKSGLIIVALSVAACGSSDDMGTLEQPLATTFTRHFQEHRSTLSTRPHDTAEVVQTEDGGFVVRVDDVEVIFEPEDLGKYPWIQSAWYRIDGNFESLFTVEEDLEYTSTYRLIRSEYMQGMDALSPDLQPSDVLTSDWTYIVQPEAGIMHTMPLIGTAEYTGELRADRWPSDRAAFAAASRESITADLNMTAEFSAGGTEIAGAFANWWHRPPGEEGTSVEGEVRFQSSGQGGRFNASDIDWSGAMLDLPNLEMRAGFFGPDAAEVGGVVYGHDENSIVQGHFFGQSAEP